MYQVLCIGEDQISDEHWQGYYALLLELKARYQTPYSLISWQTTRDRILSVYESEKGFRRAFVMKDNKFVGWTGLNGRNIGTPRQTAFFIFDLLEEYSESTLERTIVAQIDRWLDHFGLSESYCVVNDAHREKVTRSWGAQILSRLDEYVLERESARPEVIDDWLRAIPENHPDLRLEFHQMLPDEYVKPFAELLKETLRDMPEEAGGSIPFHDTVKDENEEEALRQQNGRTLYKYLLFNAQDVMVAMTLLDIDLKNPDNAFQLMTGVTGDYRGRGLGKWLKASMFRKLQEDFPANRKVTTSMRALNKPMQAINAAMGFNLVRHGFEFKLTREIIAGYLGL
jgi:hypothetical protein